mmetsp:Transcript_108/g.285  ORF Transcript_108/g.285 Transcript_108/m.285 type:complete len:88 (+) Transcript_108:291-554(+)
MTVVELIVWLAMYSLKELLLRFYRLSLRIRTISMQRSKLYEIDYLSDKKRPQSLKPNTIWVNEMKFNVTATERYVHSRLQMVIGSTD